jgi:hypothetical protein
MRLELKDAVIVARLHRGRALQVAGGNVPFVDAPSV